MLCSKMYASMPFQNIFPSALESSAAVRRKKGLQRDRLMQWCRGERDRSEVMERLISLWTWRGWFWLGWDRASELFFLSHRAWPLIASTYWIHQDPAANHWLRSVGRCGLAEVHFWEPETGWEEERGHYSKEKLSEKKSREREVGRTEEHFVSTACWNFFLEVVILVLGTW